jgi:Flp pilus assembly protein TadD
VAARRTSIGPNPVLWRFGGLLIGLALCLAGCASAPFGGEVRPDFDPALISGERLFESPIREDEVPEADVLGLDAHMRAFVRSYVRDGSLARRRFSDLLLGMASQALHGPDYDADRTLTAAETFHAGTGNCLSFTNMFIALAREADLNAVYQIVDVPPDWDVQSGFLIRYTHINVLVRNVRLGKIYDNSVTVDFNEVQPAPDFRRRVISDDYAKSLFYANRAVSLIRVGKARRGFAYLRRAIQIAPENTDLWINLGALYATEGDNRSSMEAYEVALQIDRNNRAAMAGLVRGYEKAGDEARAAYYRDRVRDYLDSNPYYHYAVARAAFESGSDVEALAAAEKAIDLDRRVGRFHFLKGLVLERLGRSDDARESFRKAERLGLHDDAKLAYIRDFMGYNSG